MKNSLLPTMASRQYSVSLRTAASRAVAGKQVKQQKTVDMKLKIGYI
jgi:hypothetical protein